MGSILRSAKVRVTLSSLFQAVQGGFGVSVTPLHFYFPVPRIKSFDGKDWGACRPCGAFDFRLQEQVQRLHTEILTFAGEWVFPDESTGESHAFHFNNGFFERVDAEVAYSFVRQRKPKRLIEGGSGNTTLGPNQLEITAALEGDANLDGSVNSADLGIVLSDWQKTGMDWDQGDFNGDGSVNSADLGLLLSNWQQTTSLTVSQLDEIESLTGDSVAANADGVGLQLVSVPEPASALITVIAGLGCLQRRRRRHPR